MYWQQNRLQLLQKNLIVTLAYALSGYIGLQLAIPPGFATILWPASGIALAAVLIYGHSVAVGIFLGSASINIWITSQSGIPDMQPHHFLPAIGIAIGAMIQAVAGAWLINKAVKKSKNLLAPNYIFQFQSLAIGSCAINATIGTASLYLGGILPPLGYGLNWLTWWVGDALGCMIVAPLILAVFSERFIPGPLLANRKLAIAVPLFITFMVSIGIFKFATQLESQQQQQVFHNRVQILANAINSHLEQQINTLNSVYALFNASDVVTRKEFHRFSQLLLPGNPELQAISWNRLILADERIQFEADMQSQGLVNFHITEKDHNGYLVPAEERSHYVVVTYIEPYEDNESALGYDISSETNRRRTLEHAVSNDWVTTNPIKLVQLQESHAGLLFLRPYFTDEILHGYITGVVAFQKFFQNSIHPAFPDDLQLRILNREHGDLPQVIYQLHEGELSNTALKELHKQGLILTTPLKISDKNWQLEITPITAFSQISWNSYFILVGIFLFTALLGIFLLTQSGRTNQIRELVRIRTRELQNSNHQLKDEIITRTQLQQEQALHNKTLEMLTNNRDIKDIMETIILHAEQIHPDMICSVLLLDDEGKHLRLCAAPSLPNDYKQAINGTAIGPNIVSCGTAAFSGKTIIVEDIATHPFWQDHKELAQRAGLAACWSFPILSSQKKVLGTFAIYYKNIKSPEASDLAYMHQLSQLANLAIEHKNADEALRIAATTFESHESIMITDKAGTILRVNKAFTDVTGYQSNEVIGKNPRVLSSGRQSKVFYQDIFKQLEKCGLWQGEIWNRRKNGDIYPEWETITAVKNKSGQTTHYVSLFADITERKAYENRIQDLAFYDPLTKLPNRRMILENLGREIAYTQRHKLFGALLFVDLDQFKTLNDSLGHHVGDELLQQIGQRLLNNIRKEDTAARIGGDEFVVLLHADNKTLEQAARQATLVARNLHQVISTPYTLQDAEFTFTSSIGLTVYPQQDNLHPLELLKQADTAMYSAKQKGRNMISFYHPDMQAHAKERLAMENDLRQALKNNDFELYYQPQINFDGQLVGFEALIRWNNKKRGWVSPNQFIPVAEETGLIIEIGQWVLNTACKQMHTWRQMNQAPDHIAINVSSREFHMPEYEQTVINTIKQAGITPQQIMLELTENIMIENNEQTMRKMHILKQAGIRISLDDFGTGYSSLSYLKMLPIDQIKIDRSFVHEVESDENNKVIVELIIEIARHMNVEVIAEGVETRTQKTFLEKKKCFLYQGFYFSKPKSVSELQEYLVLTKKHQSLVV